VGLPVGRLHDRYSEEHFKQITAEQLVAKVVKGYRRTEWQNTRDRNDPWTDVATQELQQRCAVWIAATTIHGRL
jgi:hypothetical protein